MVPSHWQRTGSEPSTQPLWFWTVQGKTSPGGNPVWMRHGRSGWVTGALIRPDSSKSSGQRQKVHGDSVGRWRRSHHHVPTWAGERLADQTACEDGRWPLTPRSSCNLSEIAPMTERFYSCFKPASWVFHVSQTLKLVSLLVLIDIPGGQRTARSSANKKPTGPETQPGGTPHEMNQSRPVSGGLISEPISGLHLSFLN